MLIHPITPFRLTGGQDQVNSARIEAMDLQFEWDNQKAEFNLKKHGIDFEEAKAVFRDPLDLVGWVDARKPNILIQYKLMLNNA